MTHLGVFTAGILAKLKGRVLWCLASRDLFAPALARAGLHPDRVIYAETWRDAEVVPVTDEDVRCPGLVGVVGEIGPLGLTASRRLQLAAEATGVVAVVLRRWRGYATSGHGWGGGERSGAVTRWRVTALPSAPLLVPGLGRPYWRVKLLRCRGAGGSRAVLVGARGLRWGGSSPCTSRPGRRTASAADS